MRDIRVTSECGCGILGRMLLLIFGPPAVGKMTVGRAVAASSDFRLFHNHAMIEPLIEVFDFGTPQFTTLLREFRHRVLEEAAAADVDLVFTLVWALDLRSDRDEIASFLQQFQGDVAFVELRADLSTRLERNRTEQRLLHKPSKRDVEWSDGNVRDWEQRYAMTSEGGTHDAGELLAAHPHLVLDTVGRAVEELADEILAWVEVLKR